MKFSEPLGVLRRVQLKEGLFEDQGVLVSAIEWWSINCGEHPSRRALLGSAYRQPARPLGLLRPRGGIVQGPDPDCPSVCGRGNLAGIGSLPVGVKQPPGSVSYVKTWVWTQSYGCRNLCNLNTRSNSDS